MQLIWLSTIWVIWKERNSKKFKHKEKTLQCLLDKIKLQTFLWSKVKYTAFDYHF